MDSFIQDSKFQGSPMVSYGRTSRRIFWIKTIVLSILLITVSITGILAWFWFYSKIPLPKNIIYKQVIINQEKLSSNTPVIWQTAKQENSPLPVLVGYYKQDNKTLPFAIKFNFIFDWVFNQSSIWEIICQKQDYPHKIIYSTPQDEFSSFQKIKRKITIYPKNFFNTDSVKIKLPLEVKLSFFKKGIWKIDNLSSSKTQALKNRLGLNFIPFSQSKLIKNYLITKHQAVSDATLNNYLVWGGNTSNTNKIQIIDSITGSKLQLQNFKYQDYELPDGDIVKQEIVNTPEFTTTSNGFFKKQVNIIKDCPGTIIARLNKDSIKNISSWLQVNLELIDYIQINQDKKELYLCYP